MKTKQEEKQIYLTKEGRDALIQELDFLKNVKRKEIAEKLKEAISFWDLSENAEYQEAKNEQVLVEQRISDLEEQLKYVVLIDEKDIIAENKVKIGSVVVIYDFVKDKYDSYKIVGTMEADILAELPRISNESIVGKALLGKRKGDIVRVNVPGGTFEYRIEDIM